MDRRSILGKFGLAAGALLAAGAIATGVSAAPADKVELCHAQGTATRPFP
jgi:hypothetical protein